MKPGRILRQAAAHIAVLSGIARIRLHRRLAAGPIALAYHRIIQDTHPSANCSYPQLHVPPALFAKHIALISSLGTVLPLDSLVDAVQTAAPLPRGFLITFDDGWSDNITEALPILHTAGAPSTIFVTTGFVGTGALAWPLRAWMLMQTDTEIIPGLELAHLGFCSGNSTGESRLHRMFALASAAAPLQREAFIAAVTKLHYAAFGPDRRELAVSWDELRTAPLRGMSIGAHTHNHVPLALASPDDCQKELSRCREELVKHLEHPVRAMSFPHSSCNADVIAATHRNGFTLSFGSTPVPAPPAGSPHRILPRIELDRRYTVGANGRFSRSLMLCRLAGLELWR